MTMIRTALPLILLLLAGCAADQGDCPGGDYAALGESEAALGLPATLPSEACTPTAANLEAYADGRRAGLIAYCRGPQGWNDGLTGEAERDFCAEDDFPDYAQAQRLAREHRAFEAEAAALRREIEALPEEEQGIKRRQLNRINGEMEAIRGVATIREWVGPQARGEG
jgi:hypothetical protein